MRRPWFAIISAASCLALGATSLQAQNRCCDSATSKCTAGCQGHPRVGVVIPSLQFLVVDRLSSAGDRLEHKLRGPACKPQHKQARPACSCAEPGCGVELQPVASPSCDTPQGIASDREAPFGSVGGNGSVNRGSRGAISDMVPKAPLKPLPSVPRGTNAFQKKTVSENAIGAKPADQTSIDAPASPAAPSVPKLLPTPVSEQVTAPKLTDLPEPVSDISETVPLPVPPALPPSLPPSLPPVDDYEDPNSPDQPLPDILVDPFIEDVGQSGVSAKREIALASSVEPAHVNALREGEPKRLSPSQKGVIARELSNPRATRIIFKRHYDAS